MQLTCNHNCSQCKVNYGLCSASVVVMSIAMTIIIPLIMTIKAVVRYCKTMKNYAEKMELCYYYWQVIELQLRYKYVDGTSHQLLSTSAIFTNKAVLSDDTIEYSPCPSPNSINNIYITANSSLSLSKDVSIPTY